MSMHALKNPDTDCDTVFPVAQNQCHIAVHDWVNDEHRLLIVDAPDVALAAHAGQFLT